MGPVSPPKLALLNVKTKQNKQTNKQTAVAYCWREDFTSFHFHYDAIERLFNGHVFKAESSGGGHFEWQERSVDKEW